MTHIIKRQNVKPQGESAAPAKQASVELLQEQGVVRAIQVRCSCGETTTVELEYTADSEVAPER